MNIQEASLIAPVFVTEPDNRLCSENRKWKSAPSATMTVGGKKGYI